MKAYSILFNAITDTIEDLQTMIACIDHGTLSARQIMCHCQKMQLALIVAQQRAEDCVIDDVPQMREEDV